MTHCEFDNAVRDAAMTGRWTASLLAHAGACDSCAELKVVVEALQRPHPGASVRPAQDPSVLWACGRHARRIATEARISVVVTTTEIGILIGVLAVLVSAVDWRAVWASAPQVPWSLIALTAGALAATTVAFAGIARWMSQTR